ncbi:MAG: Ubiquinone biosynthesis monooxygenase UbiB [uncultured Paraburkholderia sp.]|nr:MAG: Ubiquinone biosynthesis monooxygenase UbiB [uncultured Paraburkholderia sp.]
MLPRVPQLAVRYLQHEHDRARTPGQNAQLLAELGREYRRTRAVVGMRAVRRNGGRGHGVADALTG